MIRAAAAAMAFVVCSLVALSTHAQSNKADMEKLHGTWIVIGAEYDGSEAKCELKKGEKLIFDGDKFRFESKLYKEEGKFSAKGGAKTKEIDMMNMKEKKSEGIYELKGEELELCYAHIGRPAEFKSTKGVMFIKLKR